MALFGESEDKTVEHLKQEIRDVIRDFRTGPRTANGIGSAMTKLAEKVRAGEGLLQQGCITQKELEELRMEARSLTSPRK